MPDGATRIGGRTLISRFFGRSPDQLTLEDVRTFQVHLVAKGISWPGLNQIVCALRFFYGVTLRRNEIPERITYARQPRRLPEVLSAEEVARFLEAVPSLRTRVALTTAYAAGLRASEAVSLKVANIDSGRMVIRVQQGKGGKDRSLVQSDFNEVATTTAQPRRRCATSQQPLDSQFASDVIHAFMERLILTDAQWARIEPLCPGKRSDPGGVARTTGCFLKAFYGLPARVALGVIFRFNSAIGIRFIHATAIG